MTKLKHYIDFLRQRMILVVIIPWVIYAVYLLFLASPRYESTSQMIVKSSSSGAAFDPSSLLLPAVTGASLSSNESLLVQAFIESADMLDFLNNQINLSGHYMSDEGDFFSRLARDHTKEELIAYYHDKISVEVDSTSSIISLKTQAFTPAFAQEINAQLVARAENFINEINNELAEVKLEFAQSEHDIVEKKLQQAKTQLLAFQSKYSVLDPTAEGAAFQQIAFSLESALAQKKAELIALQASMSDSAPEVLSAKREISALESQISQEKLRITDASSTSGLSVSQQMANYSNLQVQLELAIQAYSASLVTLEKARVETYEQLQHLVTIESPTLPEDNAYPKIIYDLTLFGVFAFLVYGIGRIVIATIRELD